MVVDIPGQLSDIELGIFLFCRDVEAKDLQLAIDQTSSKEDLSFGATVIEKPKPTKPRSNRTKSRRSPYPVPTKSAELLEYKADIGSLDYCNMTTERRVGAASPPYEYPAMAATLQGYDPSATAKLHHPGSYDQCLDAAARYASFYASSYPGNHAGIYYDPSSVLGFYSNPIAAYQRHCFDENGQYRDRKYCQSMTPEGSLMYSGYGTVGDASRRNVAFSGCGSPTDLTKSSERLLDTTGSLYPIPDVCKSTTTVEMQLSAASSSTSSYPDSSCLLSANRCRSDSNRASSNKSVDFSNKNTLSCYTSGGNGFPETSAHSQAKTVTTASANFKHESLGKSESNKHATCGLARPAGNNPDSKKSETALPEVTPGLRSSEQVMADSQCSNARLSVINDVSASQPSVIMRRRFLNDSGTSGATSGLTGSAKSTDESEPASNLHKTSSCSYRGTSVPHTNKNGYYAYDVVQYNNKHYYNGQTVYNDPDQKLRGSQPVYTSVIVDAQQFQIANGYVH